MRSAHRSLLLEPGDRVVFTGEIPGVSREQLIRQAEELGLRPMSSVSRKTKVVVAADPDSISGKARKARECGVPVIGPIWSALPVALSTPMKEAV